MFVVCISLLVKDLKGHIFDVGTQSSNVPGHTVP